MAELARRQIRCIGLSMPCLIEGTVSGADAQSVSQVGGWDQEGEK